MPDNNSFVEALLTNGEVLKVNQDSYDAKQLHQMNEKVVWTSNIPDSEDIYFAFFNLNERTGKVSVDFKGLGLKGKRIVRDLWKKEDLGSFSKSFKSDVNSHVAKIFQISPK